MADTMSVQVKQGQLRKEPSFLSLVLKTLSYTETVTVLSDKEDWKEVKADKDGSTGWLHTSALTVKKIIMNPGAGDIKKSVSSDEYALAGKGFNKDVEKGYRAKNPHISFAWIEKMETFSVSQDSIRDFLKEGEVISKGGKS